MSDDHGELQAAIAKLDKDVEVRFARISGQLETMAATKAGEHETLAAKLAEQRHDNRSTKATVAAIMDRLDRWPKPDDLQRTLNRIIEQLDHVATKDDLKELRDDLDAYPPAQDVRDGIARSHANQLSIAKVGLIAALGGAVGASFEPLLPFL